MDGTVYGVINAIMRMLNRKGVITDDELAAFITAATPGAMIDVVIRVIDGMGSKRERTSAPGDCVFCGKPIDPDRLPTDKPTARIWCGRCDRTEAAGR